MTESSKETGQDHDKVCSDGNKDICTRKSSEEGKVQEQKWGGKRPVDVSCPVDLTVDDFSYDWDFLVMLFDDNLVVGDAVTSGQSEVREEGKGGNEGRQDVEHAFLLQLVSIGSM